VVGNRYKVWLHRKLYRLSSGTHQQELRLLLLLLLSLYQLLHLYLLLLLLQQECSVSAAAVGSCWHHRGCNRQHYSCA
jgi:hypothetical protein